MSLVDSFQRKINYLRISVTDRCNFRCIYCMQGETTFLPRQQLLTLEELAWISCAFVALGINKIRLTGGEPLLRRNILQLFEYLGCLEGLTTLAVTTNGSQLTALAKPLKKAGVKQLNISLDSLKSSRFQSITGKNQRNAVLQGIDTAIAVGFEQIKLNTVGLKNYNHTEVINLVNFAIERGLDIRFIEAMPWVNNKMYQRLYYPIQKIYHALLQKFTLIPTCKTTGGPAHYYRIATTNSHVGFITPHRQRFCATCNRIRLTTEGHLLLCLGQTQFIDLRQIVREHPNDMPLLKQTIIDALILKPSSHHFNNDTLSHSMHMIGG